MRLHRRYHRPLAAALAALALAAPSALAMPAHDRATESTSVEEQQLASHGYHATEGTSVDEQYLASHGIGAPVEQTRPPAPAAHATDTGFDWGAATVGAAAAAGIIVLISLGAPRLRVRIAR
jgi:hypothetical protein